MYVSAWFVRIHMHPAVKAGDDVARQERGSDDGTVLRQQHAGSAAGMGVAGVQHGATRADDWRIVLGEEAHPDDLEPATIDDHDTAMSAGMERRCSYIVRGLPPRRAKKGCGSSSPDERRQLKFTGLRIAPRGEAPPNILNQRTGCPPTGTVAAGEGIKNHGNDVCTITLACTIN